METEIGCSYVADVTGALEKLRQGTVDESRQRNRKEVEDNRTRRSLSPGLCRSYDWNTTHFYPDIHEENELNDLIPTYQGMGRTVRFANDRESDEEKEEGNDEELEEEEEEEMEGKGEEEWRRGQRNGEEDCMGESKKYVSSSDDFDEWNSENENDSYRNAIRGSGIKVKAIPVVQDRQGRRNGNGFSLTGEVQTCPSADLANFGVGKTGREEMDRSAIRIEPRQSVLQHDETELDDCENNVDDSKWRWEKGRTEHQRTNAPYENEEERPCNDWNQWKFIDEDTHTSIPSKKSSTQLCNNGNSDYQALSGSDDSGELQKKTKATLTRSLVMEDNHKDNRPSRTRGSCRLGQNPKPHQKGISMVTHFDDPWPVSEFGSDYTERRNEQPTFKSHDAPPIPTKEQYSRPTEGKSLRSILKQNKVADVPTHNNIIDPFGGSVLPQMEPSQSSTLPNLHRFAESAASCSASIVDDKGEVQTHETWKETGDNDAQDKRWKSESFLFLEDATRLQQSRNGKRKRFVIDYSRPSKGHVTFTGSGERRTIGPFTLNEFELCLEIPAGQHLHVKDVSPVMKDEENGCRKMEEVPMELPANRCGIGETVTGKDDLSAGNDPSPDLLWLFHSLSRNDCPTWKGSRNPCTEYQPQTRSATTTAPFHAATLENSVHTKETSAYPDNSQNADVKWKPGDVMRQQYRWSTAIREPQARILLDHWDVDPPLRPIPPPTNRYRIVRPGQDLPTKYRTTDVDSVRPNESANQNERAFTIAGQPKSSSSFQRHSSAGQPTTNFALVGISRQDGHTVPQLGAVSTDWQNERTSVRLDDAVEPFLTNQKHRYLRERVLTEDFYPELIDPTPVDPVLSRSYSDYQSLPKLEQLRLVASGAKRTPLCYETWDSDSSRSLLSLPSNLPRQRNVDMSSGGSQDSIGNTSEARIPRGQRMLGRRGNACAVVSPMRKPPTSQTQDAFGAESTSDRSTMPTSEMVKTVESRGLTQSAKSNKAEQIPAVAEGDHRPSNFRTNKKTHQTPRTVKARHEMKARRVKGSD